MKQGELLTRQGSQFLDDDGNYRGSGLFPLLLHTPGGRFSWRGWTGSLDRLHRLCGASLIGFFSWPYWIWVVLKATLWKEQRGKEMLGACPRLA